jgi:hypothetical protein
MLTGVAKKMAGQFFQAVDADIAGVRAPAAAAAAPGVPAAPAAGVPAVPGAAPAVHVPAAPVAAAAPGKDFLVGTLVGAAIALAGVAVGVIAGRR